MLKLERLQHPVLGRCVAASATVQSPNPAALAELESCFAPSVSALYTPPVRLILLARLLSLDTDPSAGGAQQLFEFRIGFARTARPSDAALTNAYGNPQLTQYTREPFPSYLGLSAPLEIVG